MPVSKHEKTARSQARDAHGHFISKGTPPQATIKTKIKVDTPFSQAKAKDPWLNDPLVSLSIQNPFKKVLYWLNDIRKHQTTSFDFKIKIPLIALPVFLAVLGGVFQLFFSFGKSVQKQEIAAQPTPTPIVIIQPTKPPVPIMVSKLGTIKATYQATALLSPTTPVIPSVVEVSPSPTSTPVPTRFVLVKGEDITFLVVPPDVNLAYYLNRRVLITGLYDKTKDTLQISKSGDIEILP